MQIVTWVVYSVYVYGTVHSELMIEFLPGHEEIVESLLQKEATVYVANVWGNTPLIFAAKIGNWVNWNEIDLVKEEITIHFAFLHRK